jgi:hypothetical protein
MSMRRGQLSKCSNRRSVGMWVSRRLIHMPMRRGLDTSGRTRTTVRVLGLLGAGAKPLPREPNEVRCSEYTLQR